MPCLFPDQDAPVYGRFIAPDGAVMRATMRECERMYASHGFLGTIRPDALPEAPAPAELLSAGPRSQEVAAQEQRNQQQAAETVCGCLLPQPYFALGTEMADVGKEKYRSIAREHDALPSAEQVFADCAARIRAEHRENFQTSARSLKFEAQGKALVLSGRHVPEVRIEDNFLSAFTRKFPEAYHNGSALITSLNPALAADVLNDRLHDIRIDAPLVQIRARDNGGTRTAFALVGPAFPVGADSDRWLTNAKDMIGGQEMKGTVVYNPATTEVIARASWNAPETIDARVGDVFRVGWQGGARDNGTQAFHGGGFAERIICRNCTIMQAGGEQDRQVHKGAATHFMRTVRDSLQSARDGFAPFARAWSALRAAQISNIKIWEHAFHSVPDALEWGVKHGEIAADVAKDVLLENLLRAYSVERGDSLADLVNAVTRAAHEAKWGDVTRGMLEQNAGELVYVLAK